MSEADRLRAQRDDILKREVEAEDRRLAEADAQGYARGLDVAAAELERHAEGNGAMRSGHSEAVTRSIAAMLRDFQKQPMRSESEIFVAGESAGYARGVEWVARYLEDLTYTWMAECVRRDLKPNGEAK